MSKLEYCCKCSDATGKAGAGDDSLYTEIDGPFCDACFDSLAARSVATTPPVLAAPANSAVLPEPHGNIDIYHDSGQVTSVDGYTADQMRAYGQACAAAERERAARICEQQANEPECPERAQYCADAIRART